MVKNNSGIHGTTWERDRQKSELCVASPAPLRKPALEYVLRVRTGNIAGWSDWSEPLKAFTARPPTISRCALGTAHWNRQPSHDYGAGHLLIR